MLIEWGVWLAATLVFAVVFIVLRQRLVVDPSRRRKHLAGIVVLAAIGGTLMAMMVHVYVGPSGAVPNGVAEVVISPAGTN